ncbi:mammalian cell entry protein [Mycobacterium sp. M1]|uniref:Mammalian cell entry protein n=1 Tax=Mycolicibacter acidiphilus TaxID=2835306 RepID=A0ABS5RJN7_9MYCO|nr:mammalian cell entry protein [Mycolicibacter acidiphilus]MBS9534470.1 mammalian cell entry protein [Mycolicibacter acidiphilus]
MGRRSATALQHGVTAVGVAAFVGLAAAGGSLYWDRVEARGVHAAQVALTALTVDEIPKVFGYDYQTVERTMMDAYPLFTDDYRREFESRATEAIIPQAREMHLVNQVDVVGVGVMQGVRRTSGSVLVYMNRTMTDKSKQTLYDGSRIRVDYQKVGSKWLIDKITPI